MNVVTLIGRLTSDPKLSYTPSSQTAVASFRLAVPKFKRDEAPDFIQCKAFGRTAENLDRFKCKGDEIAVRGRINTDSYRNKEGVMVYVTEVVCDEIEFTHGSKGRSESEDTEVKKEQSTEQAGSSWDSPVDDSWGDSWKQAEDDIPF